MNNLTQKEIEIRYTLTTTGGENRCSIGLLILYNWGFHKCPNPDSSNWKDFVNDVRVNILGMEKK